MILTGVLLVEVNLLDSQAVNPTEPPFLEGAGRLSMNNNSNMIRQTNSSKKQQPKIRSEIYQIRSIYLENLMSTYSKHKYFEISGSL